MRCFEVILQVHDAKGLIWGETRHSQLPCTWLIRFDLVGTRTNVIVTMIKLPRGHNLWVHGVVRSWKEQT